jgi:hypothetical protein
MRAAKGTARIVAASRAKAPAVPAMPQPPSFNFIRYRMTRQQPERPQSTHWMVLRQLSEPAGLTGDRNLVSLKNVNCV